jgi:hypothetical protein
MSSDRVETDKLSERYAIAVPARLMKILESLTTPQKSQLRERILVVMARAAHDALFDPCLYLKTPIKENPGKYSLLHKLDEIIDESEAE